MAPPGCWPSPGIAAPSPATLTAYLLTLVIQMDVREQSKSLIHELTAVLKEEAANKAAWRQS